MRRIFKICSILMFINLLICFQNMFSVITSLKSLKTCEKNKWNYFKNIYEIIEKVAQYYEASLKALFSSLDDKKCFKIYDICIACYAHKPLKWFENRW